MLVIPTLEEEEAIGQLLEEASSLFPRIVVVDGHSSDRTREIARSLGATVLLQEFGPGKGRGVRTAMKFFLSQTADIMCIIDGDGTNIPGDLVPLIEAVGAGDADIAMGSRTLGKRDPGSMNWITIASNRVVSYMLSARYGGNFTDIQTGYWVFSRKAIERLLPGLRSERFEVELEIFEGEIIRAGTQGIPRWFPQKVGMDEVQFRSEDKKPVFCLQVHPVPENP
jgi:dolichol-phosphate mannosyltransferase